MPENPAADS